MKTKDELVLALASSKEEALAKVPEWDLYLSLTQYRTVITLHFLHDLESILTFLSLAFQSEEITPSGVRHKIEDTYRQIDLMKITDGEALSEFHSKFDTETDSFGGFNLEDSETGKENFELDRAEVLDCLSVYLHERFDPLLNSDILVFLRDSLEHRRWPHDPKALESWGVRELRSFADHYSGLTSMAGFDITECLHQWRRLKIEMSGQPFFSLPYKGFWEHLSRHYDNIHGYPLVIKLARISLMLMPDTSCCERYVSQYNRLHNKSRSRLYLKTVRNAQYPRDSELRTEIDK